MENPLKSGPCFVIAKRYSLDQLQSQLEILDYYLGDNLDNEWHSKPPLSNDKIAEIYKDFMATYNPNDYKDK